jgi:hypothetical protein
MGELLRFECPFCRKRVKAGAAQAGHRVRCPRQACGQVLVVPGPRPAGQAPLPAATARLPFRPVYLSAPAWISAAAGFLAIVPAVIMSLDREPVAKIAEPFTYFSVPLVLASVWWLVGMYRAWQHVIFWAERSGCPVPVRSAALAVALLLTPVVNAFWAFRFYAIGKYLNRVIDQAGLDVPAASEDAGDTLLAFLWLTGIFFVLSLCLRWILALAVLCGVVQIIGYVMFSRGLQSSINACGPLLGGIGAPAAGAGSASAGDPRPWWRIGGRWATLCAALGWLALLWPLDPVAIWLGIRGLRRLGEREHALFGLALASLHVVTCIILVIVLLLKGK